MKKKSLALAAIAVLMVASLATAVTLAYFTDTKTATNTFTVGNVKIELNEPAWTDGANAGKNMKAIPGVAIPKDPYVTNTGANDAYVRLKVTVNNANAFIEAATNHQITNLGTIFGGYDEAKWDRATIIEPTATNDTLTYVYNYAGRLASGASTERLFTSVTLPAAFNNADVASLNSQFTITVVAEAIQADSFVTDATSSAAAKAFAALTSQGATVANTPAATPAP